MLEQIDSILDRTRPPGCGCRGVVEDNLGNVLELQTCPVCTGFALAALRGYVLHREGIRGREVVLVQEEFFRPEDLSS